MKSPTKPIQFLQHQPLTCHRRSGGHSIAVPVARSGASEAATSDDCVNQAANQTKAKKAPNNDSNVNVPAPENQATWFWSRVTRKTCIFAGR